MEYEIDGGESVSMTVVRAVSALRDCDPCSLRPLGEVLDTDALDALFAPSGDDAPRLGGRVSFVYSGCRVTVENGEYVRLDPLDDRPLSESDGDDAPNSGHR